MKDTSQVTVIKNLHANARDAKDMGSIPGSGRNPRVGNSNPLQDSGLENSRTKGPGGLQPMGPLRIGHD